MGNEERNEIKEWALLQTRNIVMYAILLPQKTHPPITFTLLFQD